MSSDLHLQRDASAQGNFPPVEPPNPRFIVQLFLVPALIVLVVSLIVLGLSSLVHQENDPRDFLAALRRDTHTRWMQAYNLAEYLRSEGKDIARTDPSLAREVVAALEEEIEAGRLDAESIKVRYYLCIAAGIFETPEVLPVLCKAAITERDPAEGAVRVWAVWALAKFASQRNDVAVDENAPLAEALLRASRDETRLIRSTAAFGLSFCVADSDIGRRARQRLQQLATDPATEVSFNASTQLARLGDIAGLDALLRAFDPDELEIFANDDALSNPVEEKLLTEKQLAVLLAEKRINILAQALRAIELLAPKLTDQDRSRSVAALEKLAAADLPIDDGVARDKVGVEARRLIDIIGRTDAAPAP